MAQTIDLGQVVGAVDMEAVFAKFYPVGSIYLSMTATNPGEIFGGTWEQICDRFLLAASAQPAEGEEAAYPAGTEGGSTGTHTHNLTQTNAFAQLATASSAIGWRRVTPTSKWYSNRHASLSWSSENTEESRSTAIGVFGKTEKAESMPPYLAVYMFKRTA